MRGYRALAWAVALWAALAPALGAAEPLASETSLTGQVPGAQSEATIAVSPADSRILLAASNDNEVGPVRTYLSTDGGASWNWSALPLPAGMAFEAEPSVAIDADGWQIVSFTGVTDDERHLLYATRRAPGAASFADPVVVAPIEGDHRYDDKAMIAVDAAPTSPHYGRAYAAWDRGSRNGQMVLLSHSDDHGASWSPPVRVNDQPDLHAGVFYAQLTVGADGAVYVTWDHYDAVVPEIAIDRSTDGGESFGADVHVADEDAAYLASCETGFGATIPAQARRCVVPNPVVSVDTGLGRVYVTYGAVGPDGSQDVHLAVLDAQLDLIGSPTPVAGGSPGAPSDQFWPWSALAARTGLLWICFYDTDGLSREQTRYSCTVTGDQGASFAPLQRAASEPSDETLPGADAEQYGSYEGVAAAGREAWPVWTDTRDFPSRFDEEVYGATLRDDSAWPPRAVSGGASDVGRDAATVSLRVDARGIATSSGVEYGPTAAYGDWRDLGTLTGDGYADLSARLEGLTPGTTYHYRAVARNARGLSAGPDHTFTTLAPAPIADTTPPALAFDVVPRPRMRTRELVLSWHASDDSGGALAYAARLDGAAAELPGNGNALHVGPLRDGPHEVVVEARDTSGNAATASVRWTVDTRGPAVRVRRPARTLARRTVVLRCSASDPAGVASVAWSVAKGRWLKGPTLRRRYVKPGRKVVLIRARDRLGNTTTKRLVLLVRSP